ncbi:MAG: Rieske 2Fe-2S domain-containing protein [Asticcacaulis sp.]
MADTANTKPDTPASANRMTFGTGFLRDCWWFAALSADLKPGKLQRYEILGEPVLLGRDSKGKAYALRDICPHRAAPLSAGKLISSAEGPDSVQCPYHGWEFRTTGVCNRIPSLVEGQDTDPNRIRVRAYPVREQQGLVWIWMAQDSRNPMDPDHDPVTLPGVVGGPPLIVERMNFDSHIDHAGVGLMDPAHGPYVHQQWWWRSSSRQLEKQKAFEPREFGFSMIRHAPSKNSRAYRILGGAPATEITFRLPGLRWEHIQVGERQILGLTCLTPVHETCTRITQIFWSDHGIFRAIAPIFRFGAKAFLKQDGDMVNLQNEGLRYDPSLLWIDDADKQAKWYQALKREWASHRQETRPFTNPVQPATLKWRS